MLVLKALKVSWRTSEPRRVERPVVELSLSCQGNNRAEVSYGEKLRLGAMWQGRSPQEGRRGYWEGASQL